VPDIAETIEKVRALGIDFVQVNLDNPQWKEAFLHPKSAFGIVVQVAQQASEPQAPPPQDLPSPGPATRFVAAEHHVNDMAAALRLYSDALAGEVVDRADAAGVTSVLLRWSNGGQLRLVQPPADDRAALVFGGAAHHLEFARVDGTFSAQESEQVGALAAKLGVRVQLL
jgi:hypothetical protein